jgi:hypothetical protein
VDSTTLDAVIPATLLSAAGVFPIVVSNPAPGGGTSAAVEFRVTAGVSGIPVTAPLPIAEVEGGPVQTGYIVVTPDANMAAPSVIVTYGLIQNGMVISKAAVPAASSLTDATLFVDVVRSGGRNLGVSIVNLNGTPNSVALTLLAEIGVVARTMSLTVQPYQHIARFIDELFPNDQVGSAFRGSLRVQTSSPVAMLGFPFTGPEFSTVPVAGISVTSGVPVRAVGSGSIGGPSALMFPQFAMGGGWATQIALVNPTDSTLSGRVDVFDTTGNPIATKLNASTASSFTYSLTPRGMFNLAPRDLNGQSAF